jgi:hypothetical protein
MNAPAQSTTLAALRQPTKQQTSVAVAAGFFNAESFELMQRVAKAFSSSELVPKQYQGNVANCMIALDMANRIGASPLMAMQNLYLVHGTPGWSSKFLIATVNACGRFTSLRYEWKGKPGESDYGCRAWAIERETGERLDGIWVTNAMVKAEGWSDKNGSKWKTMPDQMFVYRSAAFWQRAYAPELAMGLHTEEELREVYDATPSQDGGFEVTTESLRADDRMADAEKPKHPEQAELDPIHITAAQQGSATFRQYYAGLDKRAKNDIGPRIVELEEIAHAADEAMIQGGGDVVDTLR